MRKKLCFTCKDSWVPCHRCMGKGEIHYIEVAANSVDSDEEEHDSGSTSSEEQPPQRPPTPVGAQPPMVPKPREKANRRASAKGGVIATLSGIPRYDTLQIRGTI
jgi:hypothetical protein